ncbi:MAG: hypothetical protein IJ704_04845 [Bacilli bacterium]|nr:hypothetical protein [Bacilli bacterium]
MNHIIENYLQNLKKEQIQEFAQKNGVYLSPTELEFTHQFVQKNGMEILKNPNHLNLERYKSNYTEENYMKIQKLIPMYFKKYQHLLKNL